MIVKPDVPALPLDCSYLTAVQGGQSPVIAAAYTEHGDFRSCAYLFAFNQASEETNEVHFLLRPIWVLPGRSMCTTTLPIPAGAWKPGKHFSASLNKKEVAYYTVTSMSKNGIAFLGDEWQICVQWQTADCVIEGMIPAG